MENKRDARWSSWEVFKNENRYIVFTYWKDGMAHQNYVEEMFPDLYKLANIHEEIEEIRGKQVVCKEEWFVY